MAMTKKERLAFLALLDAEDAKEEARERGRQAYRDYRDACDIQNDICDRMNIPRMNTESYRPELDYSEPSPPSTAFEKAVNVISRIAGTMRYLTDERTRW